jgi:hypothetical protein
MLHDGGCFGDFDDAPGDESFATPWGMYGTQVARATVERQRYFAQVRRRKKGSG